MRTASPLVPRSLLTALVSSGAATDTNALTDAEFVAYVADYLPDYVARYSISIDADAPSTCVP